MVRDYYEEKKICDGKIPEITFVEYAFKTVEDEEIEVITNQDEIIRQVYLGIMENVNKEDKVYIDFTGGLRDISFFMTILIRYLEYADIKYEKIIYSNNNINKIVNLGNVYELFNLINAVDEFVTRGSSTKLAECFKSMDIKKYSQIRTLLETMNKFSDNISLCLMDKAGDRFDEINEKINLVKKIDLADENDIKIHMFIELIETIREKFYMKYHKSDTYSRLLKWCTNNQLVQQALTLDSRPLITRSEQVH